MAEDTTELKNEKKTLPEPAPAQAAAASEAPVNDFFAAREAVATGDTYVPGPEELKKRNQRNLAIALGILLFMVLVFAITVLRISAASGGAA